MRLNPAAFNRHLDGIGQQFSWRKAFACPCINPHSGAADPNCPQCYGDGKLFAVAVPALAGMSGQKTQQRWAQSGMYQSGDAVVTIQESSPMYEMGRGDRVLMLNSTDYFSLNLVRGDLAERLFDHVQTITRVFWLDVNKAIVEGGIPTVAEDGTLAWASGAPPAGVTYSITGIRYALYYCFDQLSSDRNEHSGARLPKRVVLRIADTATRSNPGPA